MTDEEKEAIKFNLKQVRESYEIHTCNTFKKAIDEALNLIEKQDKIIESQKYIIQERDIEILDLKDSRCLVKRYFKLKDENKRKDKIINKMANEIYIEHNPHFKTTEEVIEYFEKEEE